MFWTTRVDRRNVLTYKGCRDRERELGLGRGEVVAATGSWVNGTTVGQGWYDQMRLGPKCSSTWRAEL